MAPPIKYATEEERREAIRRSARKNNHKRKGIDDDGEYTAKYKCKKHTVDNKDGIHITVETLDRENPKTILISFIVTFLYNNDQEAFSYIRETIKKTLNDWLNTQSDWNSRNKIFIFEAPERNASRYRGKYASVSWQVYLIRTKEPVSWNESLHKALPLVDIMLEKTKNTCQEVGITIAHRSYVKSLASDGDETLADESAEPDATVSS